MSSKEVFFCIRSLSNICGVHTTISCVLSSEDKANTLLVSPVRLIYFGTLNSMGKLLFLLHSQWSSIGKKNYIVASVTSQTGRDDHATHQVFPVPVGATTIQFFPSIPEAANSFWYARIAIPSS